MSNIARLMLMKEQRIAWVKENSSFRQRMLSLLNTDAPPHSLALSFALGTLISLAPTPGLNTILTLMLMNFFRHLPRVGIIAAMAVWNVFVVTPMYALGYRLGAYIFGDIPDVQPALPAFGQLTSLGKGFFLGNLVTAVVLALFCYLIVFTFLGWQQNRKVAARI